MDVRLSRSALLRGVAGGAVATLVAGTSQASASARDRCELVELYPGYPGYEGFVTGVDGAGDAECLEELEGRHARFDKQDEDRANKRAARRLGIAGSPEDWTWENWLAIEGERGMSHPCYACNILDPRSRRVSRTTDVNQRDSRLLSGTFGDTFLVEMARKQYGGVSYGDPVDDYQYRALVSLVYADPHLNAPQLLDAYDAYGREWLAQYYQPGGEFLLASWLWNRTLDWGGYFPVPGSASPEDQEFAIKVAFAGIHAFPMYPDSAISGFVAMLQRAIQDWRIEVMQGRRQSLKEYLVSIGARNWYS